MAGNDLIARYVWLVDTIRRVGRISRAEISDRWKSSPLSDGKPLPRRTFYNYREGIQKLFGIEVKLDTTTNEYYLNSDDVHSESITNWLVNSASMSNVLSDSRDVAGHIFLEDVPSAREHLGSFIDSIKNGRQVQFTYHPFSRVRPTCGIIFEPYLLKLFRQRWYVAGLNTNEQKIKTYALDRISDLKMRKTEYKIPEDFKPEDYFAHSFGIVVDQSEPRHVAIKTDPRQAKYLRALPLHPTQQEMIHDNFSVFYYDIQLTQDFLNELLSMGSRITVISPPELQTMLVTALKDTLKLYKGLY